MGGAQTHRQLTLASFVFRQKLVLHNMALRRHWAYDMNDQDLGVGLGRGPLSMTVL